LIKRERRQTGDRPKVVVGHPRCGQHQPVDLPGDRPDQLELVRGTAVARGDEQRVPVLPGVPLNRGDDRREDGVGDVGDQQPQIAGASQGQ
jgi:hypothetical protein